MYYYISMSQNDFLPPFPQKLKSEVLQQSYDNEFRSYTKAIYELCLAEIEEQHFPCYVTVPSPKLLNNDDKSKAIKLVIAKISHEGGYDVKFATVQTGMSEWEDQITISRPK